MWSLQIAEGARIDGIAVIGYEPQALAHRPAGARLAFTVYDESPQRHCAVMPQRPVNDTWQALQRANDGRRGVVRDIEHARRDSAIYRGWLADRIGYPVRVIDAYTTAHVLIGPRPTAPLPVSAAYRDRDRIFRECQADLGERTRRRPGNLRAGRCRPLTTPTTDRRTSAAGDGAP